MNKYFYCYNPKLKKFLVAGGVDFVTEGINPKSKTRYWVFKKGNELQELLNLYKMQ